METFGCFVCRTPEARVSRGRSGAFTVECPICGWYEIDLRLASVLGALEDRSLVPYLSAHLSQNAAADSPAILTMSNWEDPSARTHRNSRTTKG